MVATLNEQLAEATTKLQGAKSTLEAFVMAYGNCDLKGGSLYQSGDLTEVLLFQVWLKACQEIGISPPAPARGHSALLRADDLT